jgi:hypothetical protein
MIHARERVRLRPARDPVDDAFLDLEHVHRELAQAPEARVAGADVVDGEADAASA